MNGKLLYSLKWSTFGELVSKVVPPLFFIVTARLLTPEDFGIVATSTMIVAFASIFWEAGLSKALIQNQECDIQQLSNIVFYTNLVLSLFAYFFLFLLSDSIASFFHDGRVSEVLKVSGLSLIIGALMSVQTSILQKNFEFKILFYSRFVGAIIPGMVAVAMVFMGYGYWSLIWGTIASLIFQVLILWYLSSWRPTKEYDFSVAIRMFHFSKWVLISALLSWFFIWGDIFVLGFFFTPHELGLYRTGNYFVGAVIGLVTVPVVPVMYSYFSTIQNDKEKVKEVLLFSSKIVSFFVLPIGVGLYIVQNPITDFIFGDKWIGVASVIGYLGLMHSISWIVGLNNSAYAAVGRPDIETKILILNLIIYLIVYLIAAQISFIFFIFSRLILAVMAIVIHIYASNKILNIGILETFGNIKYIILIMAFFMSFNYFFIDYYYSLDFLLMTFFIPIFMFLYLILMFVCDKEIFYKLLNILKEKKIND